MKKLTLVSVLVGSVVMAGCSSNPTAASIAKDEANAQAIRNTVAEQKVEKEQEKAEERLNAIPSWALNPPKPDAEGVFGVGMGLSKRLDLAIKKADLNAQYELAKSFKQDLSGSEQNYTQESVADTVDQYTQLVDSLVDSVPVVGYKIVKREAVAIDGQMQVYSLLKLPYDEFNAVLEKQAAKNHKQEIKEAFTALHDRIEQKKQAAEPVITIQ